MSQCPQMPVLDSGVPHYSTPLMETEPISTPVLSEEISRTGVAKSNDVLPVTGGISNSSSVFRSLAPLWGSNDSCLCQNICGQYDSPSLRELLIKIESIAQNLNRAIPMLDSLLLSLEKFAIAQSEMAKESEQTYSELANLSLQVRALKPSRVIRPTPLSDITADLKLCNNESFQSPVYGPETPIMSRAMSSGFMAPPALVRADTRSHQPTRHWNGMDSAFTPRALETNGGMVTAPNTPSF